jgi:hypothetical protein
MRQVRSSVFITALTALSMGLVACGGDNKKAKSEVNSEAKAACTGSPLSEAPRLPSNWPTVSEVTLTQQSTQGPTEVVEGYFDGDITAAHDDFKRELEDAGFIILFDELEDHDSEVSWRGQGRSGQVGLREECGETDKIYVHITNRPA